MPPPHAHPAVPAWQTASRAISDAGRSEWFARQAADDGPLANAYVIDKQCLNLGQKIASFRVWQPPAKPL